MLRCDCVLIVAKIARAVTDQSLRSSLFLALSSHVPMEWEDPAAGPGRFKFAVVCTRTDDINLAAARAEFVGPNKRIAPDAMARLDRELAAARQAHDYAGEKAAKRQQKSLLMRARNAHVQEGLRRTYASEMAGGHLDVFCVSSKWYDKFCPVGDTALVEVSEIPTLRRFCHSVAANAQLREATYFLQSRLSSLLGSLDLWAANALAEGGDGGAAVDSAALHRHAEQVKRQVSGDGGLLVVAR